MRHERSDTAELSRVVRAIEHPARRMIVDRLVEGDADVGELAELVWDAFRLMQSSTSNHLRVLRDAGVVGVYTVRTERRCFLRPAALAELARWVTRCTGST